MIAASMADSIDQCVKSAMRRQRIPGVSLAIGSGGQIKYSRGYGFRNVPDALPVDDRTIFGIASISKQFTAAAVLRLAEDGLVSLDDRIARYFPKLPFGDDIRIHHLLSHTSGIPGYTEAPDFDQRCQTQATPEEIVATVSDRNAAFRPGDQWQYSNTNYVLLGRLIEVLSGQAYADYLNSKFLAPAGLERTGIDDLTTIRDNESEAYSAYALGPLERARKWEPCWTFGTGGLYSTATDLVRWNVALRSRLLSEWSYRGMTTSNALTEGLDAQYGFGLVIQDAGGLREIRHGGSLPGFSLINSSYPDIELDIVVLANIDRIDTQYSIVRPILSLLLNRTDLTVRKHPATNEDSHAGPDPRFWIAASQNDQVDGLPLTSEFRRFLNPHRRAALCDLKSLGDVVSVEYLESGRRDPQSSFAYKVHFKEQPMLGRFTLTDSGHVAHFNVLEWDDRSTA